MSIRVEQVFVPASPSTVKIADVPAGPVQVIISAITSGATISYGPNQASLSGTTGSLVNAGQSVTLNVPLGAPSQQLYGTGVGGTAIAGVTYVSPN